MRRQRPPSAFRTSRVSLGLFLLLLLSSGRAYSQAEEPARVEVSEEASSLANRYVNAYVKQTQLTAEIQFFKDDTERLKKLSGPPFFQKFGDLDPASQDALKRLGDDKCEQLLKELETATTAVTNQADGLVHDWEGVRAGVNENRLALSKARDENRTAGHLASLLSVDKRWFWLCFLVAIAALAVVGWHDRRHAWRRMVNGGRARALGLSQVVTGLLVFLVLLTATVFVLGDRVYRSLLHLAAPDELALETLRKDVDKLEEGVAGLQKKRDLEQTQYAKALDDCGRKLQGEWPKADKLVQTFKQVRERLRTIKEQQAVQEAVAAKIADEAKAAGTTREELKNNAKSLASYEWIRTGIQAGLGGVLLALAGTVGFLFWKGVRKRDTRTASTCPLCLHEGKLEPVPPAGRVGTAQEAEEVQCRNIINQEPYEECNYTFANIYREMTKVCFPTLGVPQSGKTFWLASVYKRVNEGGIRQVKIETVRSNSSDDFDRIVEEIYEERVDPQRTQTDVIPKPLVFNFLDKDRYGASNVLVNVFDYSGEITLSRGADDYHRRRALEADGFLFFLDPTYPIMPQANALANFREHLRRIKKLKAHKQLRVPVALCVSKIDLLINEEFALPGGGGGNDVEKFYTRLREIDPSGAAFSLDAIEARSQLIQELRDTIWPGWQIEDQIGTLFGGRYKFFPLTPVGLDVLGQRDLRGRTLAPFATAEPLLWLLQMNGYKVLS